MKQAFSCGGFSPVLLTKKWNYFWQVPGNTRQSTPRQDKRHIQKKELNTPVGWGGISGHTALLLAGSQGPRGAHLSVVGPHMSSGGLHPVQTFWSPGKHRCKPSTCAPWASHQVLNHQFQQRPNCSPTSPFCYCFEYSLFMERPHKQYSLFLYF